MILRLDLKEYEVQNIQGTYVIYDNIMYNKGAARPKLGGHEFPYTEWGLFNDTRLFILVTQRSVPINC